MVGVPGATEAHHFRVDGSVALQRQLQFFQDEDGGAFTEHKAVPVLVEGSRSLGGLVVSGRKRPHGIEPGDTEGGDGGFHAPRHHDVADSVADQVKGLAERVGSRRAGGLDGKVRPLGLVMDGNQPRSHVSDQHGDEEGADLLGTRFQERPVGILDGGQTPQAAAQYHAGTLPQVFRDFEGRIVEGQLGAGHGVGEKDVHLSDILP